MPRFVPFRPDASPETTRALAARLVASLHGSLDADDVLAAADIWIAGDAWWSGDLSAEKAQRVQAQFHRCIKGGAAGLAYDVRSIVVEGNRAAIELTASGTWYDGRPFRRDLHIAIDVEDDRIVAYREYGYDADFFTREPELPPHGADRDR